MNAKTLPSRWAVVALYAFAFTLFFWPVTDLVTNALPLQLGNVRWRYGFLGLLGSYLLTPSVGIFVASGVAYALRHRRTLRVLSVLELIIAIALLAAMAMFVLDLMQVRGTRPEEARAATLVGGVITLCKEGTAAGVLAILGVGAWRTAGRMPRERGGASDAGIVMRQKKAAG
jgi:hypothetical protein